MAASSAAFRGGPSRIRVRYRLERRASYAVCVLVALTACSYLPARPPNAIVAESVPAAWYAAPGSGVAEPVIVGARFSSLDVELGDDWNGDIVTSANVERVVLHTNLFDIATLRSSPGRFHFLEHIIDDPAFIVRPYALEIIATDARDHVAKMRVPFRIRGHGAPRATSI